MSSREKIPSDTPSVAAILSTPTVNALGNDVTNDSAITNDCASNSPSEDQIPIAEVIHQIDDVNSLHTNEMAVAHPLSGCLCYFRNYNLKYFVYFFAAFLVFIATTVYLVQPKKSLDGEDTVDVDEDVLQSHRHNNYTESNTLKELRGVLSNIFSDKYLNDIESPQYQAMHWLADLDNYTISQFSVGNETNHPYFIQRYVATLIYYSTDGPGWRNQLNFLQPVHTCDWRYQLDKIMLMGIICDAETLSIAGISLQTNLLNGTIPDEIGILHDLQVLFMGGNSLHGNLPSSISNLVKLKDLHICCNSLTGRVPFLGNLTNLAMFSVWGNELTGSLSSLGLKGLSMLTQLTLSGNKFNGTIPEDIYTISNLQSFWIMSNDISGTIPSTIGNLTNLNVIKFSDNIISGPIPETLGELKLLQSLDLSRNLLTGTVPLALGELKQLYLMNMAYNDLNGSVNFLCKDDLIPDFQMDCEEVQCDCCSTCV